MRKKSHLALSAYLVEELRIKELDLHRKSFCFGSIQPDLNPKMLSEPHEYDVTWDKVKRLILRIESESEEESCDNSTLWMHMGIVTHYLADYFTFPHNTCFEDGLKEHCRHESELKYLLRAYLCTPEAHEIFEKQKLQAARIHSAQQLFSYIEQMHGAYMLEKNHSALSDCRWIMQVCGCAAIVLVRLVSSQEQMEVWLGGCVA
ncbi:MAG: zinc dependent phospholipase C family protein [Lachnospiraceae bacterium]|nr:zinc dependent phospholipase C family protein [Lachnospiraceae bacterium]